MPIRHFDYLARGIVHFPLSRDYGAMIAQEVARTTLADAIEASELLGAGTLATVRLLPAASDGSQAFDITAEVRFRVLGADLKASKALADEMLKAEITNHPLFTAGAVVSIEDDQPHSIEF